MRTFDELFPEDDVSDPDGPAPSAAIRELIKHLETRWPAFDESSPWALAPLEGEGRTLYVNLVFGRPDSDLSFMADSARRLGVVCFDPQLESVL